MDSGKPGRRYLLGGENLTLLELLQILSEMTGVAFHAGVFPMVSGSASLG